MTTLAAFDMYTIGWICPLPLELTAARAMLDEEHKMPNVQIQPKDESLYTLGRIGQHYVVLASLPKMGTNPAVSVATRMLYSFKNIKLILLVGIGGGVPSYGPPGYKRDIFPGDVVVSYPRFDHGGVVHYEFGAWTGKGNLQFSGHSNSPPNILLSAVNKLQSNHQMASRTSIPQFLSEMLRKLAPVEQQEYGHQGADRLYRAEYNHQKEDIDCEECCDPGQLIRRAARETQIPQIHYGGIASSNQIVISGDQRDDLQRKHSVICFEMEAAGLMDLSKCLVIRGICDYADSHKNKKWQKYAAATAAAYAKELLGILPAEEVVNDKQTTGNSKEQAIPPITYIITRTLYLKDDIPLASLVPDKRYPNQDAITGISVEEGVDFSVSLDRNFNERTSTGSGSFFKAAIARLLSMSGASDPDCRLNVSADEGRIYLLRQPRALFKRLCAIETVKKWLEEGCYEHLDTYFVVGYRTLLNPGFVCQDSTAQGSIPSGARGKKEFSVLGERIYSICYRRVCFKFFKGVDSAFLNSENRWKPFYKDRVISPTDDEVIEADIEHEDEGGDGTFEKFAAGDNEEIFVSLASGDEGGDGGEDG